MYRYVPYVHICSRILAKNQGAKFSLNTIKSSNALLECSE